MVRDVSGHEIEALHYELLLKDILSTAEKLPPFPDTVWKVMPLVRRMAPVSEIEAVIKYDQVITARILTLSQSAYYARKHSINSLQEAIVTLGNQKLVQVILTACASRYFEGEIPGRDAKERQLWQHSVASAVTGEMIARTTGQKSPLKVYLAGLLHDIGKTVLHLYARIYLGSDLPQTRKRDREFLESERRALGVDHQALGRIISRRWRLPPEVITAIGYHHCPQEAQSDYDIAAIVYAANRIASATVDPEEEKDELLDVEHDPVFRDLGITGPLIERFQVQLSESMEGIKLFLTSDATPYAAASSACRSKKQRLSAVR